VAKPAIFQSPQPSYQPKPGYPLSARRRGKEGIVVFEVSIATNGAESEVSFKLRPLHGRRFCFQAPTVGALGEAKMRGKRDDPKDGGGRATQDAKAELTGVNDRLSRACPMSVANALGAFLPTVGAFRRRRMGAKELSCKGLKL